MWLSNETEIIFNMKDEAPLSLKENPYYVLNKFISLKEWVKQYTLEYRKWLNDEQNSICDIRNRLNSEMIDAIKKANDLLNDDAIFYWFDIDRTYNEGFEWKTCPITGNKLVDLGSEYTEMNQLVCFSSFLVLPATNK